MSQAAGCTLTYKLDGVAHSCDLVCEESILGRSPGGECGVVIASESVSRRHASVRREGDRWLVRDLGAVNGVRLNGTRIPAQEPRVLRDGDALALGDVEMAVHIKRAPATASIVFDEGGLGGGQTVFALADLGKSLAGAAWVLNLFDEAAESLLSSENLDAMLGNVLTLTFKHLPAERGSVCLYDAVGELVQRASRTARGVPDEPLRLSQTIVKRAIAGRQAVLYTRGPRTSDSESIAAMNIRSAMCVPLVGAGTVVGLLYADTEILTRPFNEEHLKIFSALAKLSAVAVAQTKLKEEVAREQAIRERLARYSGSAVVDRIMRSSGGQMTTDDAEVSVMFADLSGFTTLSEQLPPAAVTRILNGVFERLTRVVFTFGGTLDKFIGDEVMVFFGAPLAQEDHARRAVGAALEMRRELAAYNAEHPDQQPLDISTGINSGSVVVGDVGSHDRRDYTVIGDTVNTAKRIQTYASGRGRIAIGPATYAAVSAHFRCEPQAPMALKGKTEPVATFLVEEK